MLLIASVSYSQNSFTIRGNAEVNNFGNGVIEANNTKIILEETARINNSGTIQVKDKNDGSQQAVGVEFFGIIENDNGYLDLNYFGSSLFNQPAIAGRVAFSSRIQGPNARQFIPLIEYDSVLFFGTKKFLQKNINGVQDRLVAKENFTSKNTLFEYSEDIDIDSHKHTEHDSRFESGFDNVIFTKGSDSLDARVNGTGQFKTLRIDNPNDVDITRGGFEVSERLELRSGLLNNSTTANFYMADSSIVVYPANFRMMDESGIYRQSTSSLNIEPEFEGTVLVQYEGDGSMVNTGELPSAENVLTDLNVLNNGGVTFTKDVFVRDRMEVGANIYMDENGNEHTLYFLSPDDTGLNFSDSLAEVYGNMARSNSNLPTDSRLTFNNAFTFLRFNTDDEVANPDLRSDGGSVDTVIIRIEPGRGYDDFTYGEDSEFKVQRKMRISAKDNQGNEITEFNNATYGYAWRHDDDADKASYHETRDDKEDVIFSELGLQRFDSENTSWIDESSQIPTSYNEDLEWAHGISRLQGPLGEFAIGLNLTKYLTLIANAILEGPYDIETGFMIDSLQNLDIFPRDENGLFELPRQYPFETARIPDERRFTLTTLPDSVVDWILIEFRDGQEDATESFYKPAFLKYDGSIVDTNGSNVLTVWRDETGGINVSGEQDYYIAIRHRNHLAVVSQNPIRLSSDEENPESLNFAQLDQVYMGSQALKFLGLDSFGERIYALYGGNPNRLITDEFLDRQFIGQDDLDNINLVINSENFRLYLREDVNLDGVVNAADFNISWNNQRNRYAESFVK